AAGVALDGSVEELLDAAEFHDLGKLAIDLAAPHSEDGSVEEDVLSPGQLGVESSPHFQQARHVTVEVDRAGRRVSDAGQQFQESALACPVPANDADGLSPPDVEIDILDRPEFFPVLST